MPGWVPAGSGALWRSRGAGLRMLEDRRPADCGSSALTPPTSPLGSRGHPWAAPGRLPRLIHQAPGLAEPLLAHDRGCSGANKTVFAPENDMILNKNVLVIKLATIGLILYLRQIVFP